MGMQDRHGLAEQVLLCQADDGKRQPVPALR